MYRPRDLGRILQRHRRTRELSAYAAAKAAGFSANYYRLLERGLSRPSAAAIDKIGLALQLSDAEVGELRRLSGIDPDPGATPEAKAARRDAWPLLTYILVNHVLLPRLELGQVLSQKGRRAPSVARALRAAAEADNLFAYCQATDPTAKPPRAVVAMLEDTFAHLDAGAIQRLRRIAKMDAAAWRSEQRGPLRHPRTVGDRWLVARPLLKFRSPDTTEMHAFLRVERSHFNHVFAVRLFPLIYYDACRFWPFSKIFMPYACHGKRAQRRFYELARQGIPIDEFDTQLLRPEPFTLPASQRNPDDLAWLYRGTSLLSWQTNDGRTTRIEGPLPRELDQVFDHLDRCEFLDRFPLIKLGPEQFAPLAASHELPSWRLLRDHLLRRGGPSDVLDHQPSLTAPPTPARDFGYEQPESLIVRMIADAFQQSAGDRADMDEWAALRKAAAPLQLGPSLDALIRDLCAARRDPPTNTDSPALDGAPSASNTGREDNAK